MKSPLRSRPRSLVRGVGLAVLGLVAASAALAEGWADDRARSAIASAAEVGLRAPACEVQPLVAAESGVDRVPSGETAFVRGFEGRVTLVDFWASWCPTCEHAFAFLDALARDYHAAGLDVVAINLDSDPQDARDFLAGRRVAFEVVRDATGRCPRGFGLVGMPQTFLLDASGRVRAVTRGFRAGEARAMRDRIESLLADSRDALPSVAAGRGSAASLPTSTSPASSSPASPAR